MNIKHYTKLSALAVVFFAASTAQAELGNVCITVENISANATSIEAYDTIDAVHWVGLTGGPLRIAPESTGHGCFKTAYKSAGVDIRVTAVYMGDIVAGGGLTLSDVSVEGSYEGKAIQTTTAGYSGFIGTFKDNETLVIR